MGTGSSRDFTYGVPINPRVDYANSRSKKENKIVRIDAPALVQLRHGTLRYRNEEINPDESRREKPHETKTADLKKKQDYFYHAKRNFRSTDPIRPDESWKYCYVYKGAERAKQKKLFYVFGKGLKFNNDTGFVQPHYKPDEQSFQRPIFYKVHGHAYMDLIFLKLDPEKNYYDEDKTEDPLSPQPDEDPLDPETFSDIEVRLPKEMSLFDIKIKLARKFVKPIGHIHIYMKGTELKNDQNLVDLTEAENDQSHFDILLHPK